MKPKDRLFWPIATSVLVVDIITKWLAHRYLLPFQPTEVFGDVGRLTLSYNTGAAFGISLFGSRWVYVILTLGILGILYSMYRDAAAEDRWQAAALGLIVGGALGNLVDRVRWTRGVVDFIDIGIGDSRFWTFNVADSGISVGAVLMVLIFILHSRKKPDGAGEAAGS